MKLSNIEENETVERGDDAIDVNELNVPIFYSHTKQMTIKRSVFSVAGAFSYSIQQTIEKETGTGTEETKTQTLYW